MQVALVNIQESSRDDDDGCEDEIKEDKNIQTRWDFWILDIVSVGERAHRTAS